MCCVSYEGKEGGPSSLRFVNSKQAPSFQASFCCRAPQKPNRSLGFWSLALKPLNQMAISVVPSLITFGLCVAFVQCDPAFYPSVDPQQQEQFNAELFNEFQESAPLVDVDLEQQENQEQQPESVSLSFFNKSKSDYWSFENIINPSPFRESNNDYGQIYVVLFVKGGGVLNC